MGPLESPWSKKVKIHWLIYSDSHNIWRDTRCILLHFQDFTEITIYRFSTFLTSSPLADKQQKMGEHVENIKSSLDTLLNFMFSTFSPVFCCLSTRGPDISSRFFFFPHASLRLLHVFDNSGLLCGISDMVPLFSTRHCLLQFYV